MPQSGRFMHIQGVNGHIPDPWESVPAPTPKLPNTGSLGHNRDIVCMRMSRGPVHLAHGNCPHKPTKRPVEKHERGKN